MRMKLIHITPLLAAGTVAVAIAAAPIAAAEPAAAQMTNAPTAVTSQVDQAAFHGGGGGFHGGGGGFHGGGFHGGDRGGWRWHPWGVPWAWYPH
jgi:hypothetical protein